jgi:hypothetical protein
MDAQAKTRFGGKRPIFWILKAGRDNMDFLWAPLRKIAVPCFSN